MADAFVLLDDVAYSKGDWRNRNLIKTRHGLKWMTIPLIEQTKTTIREIRTAGSSWAELHWKQLTHNYQKSRFFTAYSMIFENLYQQPGDHLSSINRKFIEAINAILGIDTPISWSYEHNLVAGKNERLIEICRSFGANTYLSGPAAKSYIDEALFRQHGIKVEWMDYTGYPEYRQLFPPFEHGVTILDLLFNEGPESKKFMKSFGL